MVDPTGNSVVAAILTGLSFLIFGASLVSTPKPEIKTNNTPYVKPYTPNIVDQIKVTMLWKEHQRRSKAKAAKTTTTPANVRNKVQDKHIRWSMEKALGKPKEEATTVTIEKELPPEPMQTVYRVYGGKAKMFGRSWTPTDPRMVKNYRDAAGLPSGGESGSVNTGEYLAVGVLHDMTGVEVHLALPLDGNKGGGVIEYYVPNPETQITIFYTEKLDPPL